MPKPELLLALPSLAPLSSALRARKAPVKDFDFLIERKEGGVRGRKK